MQNSKIRLREGKQKKRKGKEKRSFCEVEITLGTADFKFPFWRTEFQVEKIEWKN